MAQHTFVGFGFGPIQSGLFAHEAFASGNFERIVVAEIDQALVDAVRANGGRYAVNIAHNDRVVVSEVAGIEMLNPTVAADRAALLEALAAATEITTSLPAVNIFTAGGENSVAALIAKGLAQSTAPGTIVYTGENNNHAAEILEEAVGARATDPAKGTVQYLNTVIGKMSRVVTDADEVAALGLEPMAAGIGRAFLVEAFNKILVTQCAIEGFRPGIEVFQEKQDLLPFEEAKLFGHNAIHALLAYLGAVKGYRNMTELKDDAAVMAVGRRAFLDESGAALIKKYAAFDDELFTPAGYQEFAEDLLVRMTNPYLVDTVARAARDPLRKLSYSDRIYGTMGVALEQGVTPTNMALGAAAGVACVLRDGEEYDLPGELQGVDWRDATDEQVAGTCRFLWKDGDGPRAAGLIKLTQAAYPELLELTA